MDYKTKLEKSRVFGWTAQTDIDLGEAKDDQGRDARRVLEFKTYKSDSGTSTTASACILVDYGTHKSRQMALFQDYFKTVQRHSVSRSTEKAIRQAHEMALRHFSQHIEAAKAQYAQQ